MRFSFHCRSDFANGDETHIWRRKHTHMEMKHAQRSGWHSNVPEISAVFFFLLFYYLATILLASVVSLVSAVSFRWFRYSGLFSSFRVLVHAIWTLSGYLTVNFNVRSYDNGELEQTRPRRQRQRHLKM